MSTWFVYILKCSDGSLYTGITTDTDRRLAEHKAGTASKYTAARGVESMIHTEPAVDRSTASQREAEIKQMTREDKLSLVNRI